MRRILLRSSPFVRSAKRVIKKDPRIAPDIEDALVRLEEDAFDSKLKTHRLRGKFKDSWACSAGYDLRIIFKFVKHKRSEAILLETIGTHDEVY